MKSAQTSLHSSFPETPVSQWAGARWLGWTRENDATGNLKRLRQVRHPFLDQRKVWCLLEVHFDGVDLLFATPQELDQFIDVLSQNPLPSGRSLVTECAIGRPNRHWLARLPKRAKSLKFRERVCRFLKECHSATKFRDFYKGDPVNFVFHGFHDSLQAARNAEKGHLKS